MQDKKYLEYRVVEWDSPAKKSIVSKQLTKRGSVMISERDAKTNNLQTQSTGLFYELAEEKKETSANREVLISKANELGIKFKDNIGDAKLLEKILAIEPNYGPEFKSE